MHLQIRSTVSAPGANDGPGAMRSTQSDSGTTLSSPGRLVRLLELLADDRSGNPDDGHGPFNLIMASGSGIETTGQFTFAVEADGRDQEREEHEKALARIKEVFPASEIVELPHGDIPHRKGALLEFLRSFSNRDVLIDQIFMGVGDCRPASGGGSDCSVPVQVSVIDAHAGR